MAPLAVTSVMQSREFSLFIPDTLVIKNKIKETKAIIKENCLGGGYSSVVEFVVIMQEALGSVTERKKK